MNDETPFTDEQWQERLSAEQFAVCRRKGTERPFSGKYYAHKAPGLYCCACCLLRRRNTILAAAGQVFGNR